MMIGAIPILVDAPHSDHCQSPSDSSGQPPISHESDRSDHQPTRSVRSRPMMAVAVPFWRNCRKVVCIGRNYA